MLKIWRPIKDPRFGILGSDIVFCFFFSFFPLLHGQHTVFLWNSPKSTITAYNKWPDAIGEIKPRASTNPMYYRLSIPTYMYGVPETIPIWEAP